GAAACVRFALRGSGPQIQIDPEDREIEEVARQKFRRGGSSLQLLEFTFALGPETPAERQFQAARGLLGHPGSVERPEFLDKRVQIAHFLCPLRLQQAATKFINEILLPWQAVHQSQAPLQGLNCRTVALLPQVRLSLR